MRLKTTIQENRDNKKTPSPIKDGELFSNVTVNLNHPLQSDDMAFLDENNLPGIGKWLEKRHLAIHMGVMVRSGFCTYPLYMLLDKHLPQ